MPHSQTIDAIIDAHHHEIIELSDTIWEHPELRFKEFQSSQLLSSFLEEQGFVVERGIGGLPTAFSATYGNEKPVIGILGEYDALPGLSQVAESDEEIAILEGGNGHGCGHNLLGTAGVSAVLALKKRLEDGEIKGTIQYFGCPAEEGGSGKTYMVREGVFDHVDTALTWHPHSMTGVFSYSSLANYQVYFEFSGKAAHAADSPHLGRSALDATELMNVGVNYLREHMIPEARVHYAVTDTGGRSPNVVQAHAEVLYLIRAPKINQVHALYERVVDIAKGAALMTGTTLSIRFDKACSDYVPNHVINQIVEKKLQAVGLPEYSAEEYCYAKKMAATITADELSSAHREAERMSNFELEEDFYVAGKPFFSSIIPYRKSYAHMTGSTDVGDVSWVVPTAQFFFTCFVAGTPLHTWQLVSQGKTSLAHKGLLHASKTLAKTAEHLFLHPEVIDAAKKEHDKVTRNRYQNPIPAEILPAFHE